MSLNVRLRMFYSRCSYTRVFTVLKIRIVWHSDVVKNLLDVLRNGSYAKFVDVAFKWLMVQQFCMAILFLSRPQLYVFSERKPFVKMEGRIWVHHFSHKVCGRIWLLHLFPAKMSGCAIFSVDLIYSSVQRIAGRRNDEVP